MKNVYEVTSTMMRFCLLLSVLEIVHVQLKLVKASMLPTITQVSLELSYWYIIFYACLVWHVQVFGRLLVLFGVIASVPILQSNRAVAMLFSCWSAIEIFRYVLEILL